MGGAAPSRQLALASAAAAAAGLAGALWLWRPKGPSPERGPGPTGGAEPAAAAAGAAGAAARGPRVVGTAREPGPAAGAGGAAAEAAGAGATSEAARAAKAWKAYQDFVADPGPKCPTCWLLRKHCSCHGLEALRAELRMQVVLVMHYSEVGRHLGSNTAKLLLHFGAELLVWGLESHERRLAEMVGADPEGTVVLFPSAGAVAASEMRGSALPRRVIVVDGGWRECKRMNESIDSRVRRCVVTGATRQEYGGTRKYASGAGDGGDRVQTAAAFAALLEEFGEAPAHVLAVKDGLAHFMRCWEAQIGRSKTFVT